MSLFVWSMVGIALWHFMIFVPDKFVGGIVGAFLAGWLGGVASGLRHPLYAVPGSLLALASSYAWGASRERQRSSGADVG